MMWYCILLCVLIITTSVNCQLDAEQVYKLLSSRMNVENSLMRNDLIKLEEKIDLKEANLNQKIDSISARISLLEKDQGKTATEDLQQDTDNGRAQNRAIYFDSIQSQLTIFRQALNSEKQMVRNLESAVINKTDYLTENLNAINDKVEQNEIKMNRLNETCSQPLIEEKQNLQLLETLFVHQFDSLSEKQNITVDMIDRVVEEMKHFNETMNSDHNMFNQQLERINQTQDVVESQIKTMSQEQQSMDSTIQSNEQSLNQVVNKQTSLDTAIQSNQQSLNQVVNKQSSLNTAIQSNQRSLNQIVNKQSSLDSAIQSNERSLNRIWSRMDERKIAFHAELHTTRRYLVGSKIVFDFIVFQQGSGYNPDTGIFTCPVSGVYLFSVVLANAHTHLRAVLKADSVTKVNILSVKGDYNPNDQSSSLVIIRLSRGAKVWVEIFWRSASVQKYDSSFSGSLLYT